jgi:hypothetical protein
VTLDPEVIDAYVTRARAAAVAQGLPEHLEDPDALDRIARIVDRPERAPTRPGT